MGYVTNPMKEFFNSKGHLKNDNYTILDNITDYFTFANITDLIHNEYFSSIYNALLINQFNENVTFNNGFSSNILSYNPYYFTDINLFYNDIELTNNILCFLPKEFLCNLTNLTLTKNDTLKIINFFPGFDTHDMLACLEI